MTNELTALLTTIASASASFVAILGGFIASKLIAVNGEREAVQHTAPAHQLLHISGNLHNQLCKLKLIILVL